MKNHLLAMAIFATVLPCAAAAEPIGVNTASEKITELNGREITLIGLVDRVSAARRMVVLIDTSEATCKDSCQRKTIMVQLPADAELPAKGATILVTGMLLPDPDAPELTAVRVSRANP